EIGGASSGVQYDRLTIDGAVFLDGTLNVSLINGYIPSSNDSFLLIDNTSTDPVNGIFIGLPEGATVDLNGVPFKISYVAGTGNDVGLISAVSVPEPSLLLLIAGGTVIGSCCWSHLRRAKLNKKRSHRRHAKTTNLAVDPLSILR